MDSQIISWDQYFMAIAKIASHRSKDPRTIVGACIVKDNHVISTGYNGMPNGCDDTMYPWVKGNENAWDNKYFYVVHAELNAILNSIAPVNGSTLYVTKFPCNECAKAIIQSGIKKIYYVLDEDDKVAPSTLYIKRMFKDAGVELVEYKYDSPTMINIVV